MGSKQTYNEKKQKNHHFFLIVISFVLLLYFYKFVINSDIFKPEIKPVDITSSFMNISQNKYEVKNKDFDTLITPLLSKSLRKNWTLSNFEKKILKQEMKSKHLKNCSLDAQKEFSRFQDYENNSDLSKLLIQLKDQCYL